MSEIKVGDKVKFVSHGMHEDHPNFYPKVGTLGVVVGDALFKSEHFLNVKWEDGSTSKNDLWGCRFEDIEKVEDEIPIKVFHPGQYVIYKNGESFEIGKIKYICEEGISAFVFYHAGATSAKTSYNDLFPIKNECYIKETGLGVMGDE